MRIFVYGKHRDLPMGDNTGIPWPENSMTDETNQKQDIL